MLSNTKAELKDSAAYERKQIFLSYYWDKSDLLKITSKDYSKPKGSIIITDKISILICIFIVSDQM